jgi:hypothetical protein
MRFCRVKQAIRSAAIIGLPLQQQASGVIHHETSNIMAHTASRPDAATTHWAKNILLWITYLPHDCVQSMIRMGWHDST